MADPFEVRVRFSSQLQNLNASVTSAQKAAAYALKYKDMDEDLHSCILEQLEKVSQTHRPARLCLVTPQPALAVEMCD
jgi:CTD kinase subunit gamma